MGFELVLTLELVFFLFVFSLSLALSFLEINNKFYYLGSFVILMLFSLVVRLSGFDADMGNYEMYLEIKSLSIYYLKEPVYWLGSRYLFELTDSALIVFLLYDSLFIMILLFSCNKLSLPKYFPFAFFLFFPTVLGMQNVFRQFIASGFLLLLLSLVFTGAKYKYRFFVLMLATLTHNVSLLFTPLAFINNKKRGVNLFFVISCVGIFLLLPIAAGTKSDSDTGDLPPLLYLVVYFVVVTVYLIIVKFDFSQYEIKYKQYFNMMLYFILLILLSVFVLGGAQSKRVGMLSLLLSLVPLALLVESRFKQKILVRMLFIVALTVPTLVFHNARSLLETSPATLESEAAARALNHH
jgi:hypothetical protein